MASLKRRAREKSTGKYVSNKDMEQEPKPTEPKKKVGRPRKKKEPETFTFELSVTISVGGADVAVDLLDNINSFLVKECLAGKCSLERGGAAFHLHYQMVIRIESINIVSVSRLLKTYLGWDKKKPDGGMIICKKLTNKALHTFHGMLGYCMKDASKDHFQTIDHNVTAEDIELGLEQLALHGQEECKRRIMLTQRNFAQKCLQWRRWNYKHPAIVDWQKEFFLMMKTGKYYPCTSWVVGTFGRGYEPHRMQSYWKMLVSPELITHEDVNNVFCQPEHLTCPCLSRKQWFQHRWEDAGLPEQSKQNSSSADGSLVEILMAMKTMNCSEKNACNTEQTKNILIHTPIKNKEQQRIVAEHGPDEEQHEATKQTIPESNTAATSQQRRRKVSPTRRLWPAEWNIDELCASQDATESTTDSLAGCESVLAFGEYAPVYKRPRLGIFVS